MISSESLRHNDSYIPLDGNHRIAVALHGHHEKELGGKRASKKEERG